MIDELNQAIEAYHAKWHKLVNERNDKAFFQVLKPTSVGWKTEDLADFNERTAELQPLSEQVHLGWVNERLLGTFYLRDEVTCDVRIIKLMQRRPNSADAAGLDHLDFLIAEDGDAKVVLEKEEDLNWTEEKNGDHCKWLSIWFDGTEAKLRSDTVLQVCADEMLSYQTKLLEEI